MSWLSSPEVGPVAVWLVICIVLAVYRDLLFPIPQPSEEEIERHRKLRWKHRAAMSRFWASFLTNLGQAILAALMLSLFLLNATLPPAPDAAAVADAQPGGRTLVQALGPRRSLLWFSALACASLLVGSGSVLLSAAVAQDAAAEDADARRHAWVPTVLGRALAVLGLAFLTGMVWLLLSHPIW